MTLRVKTILISFILILGLMIAVGIISYHTVTDVFSRLEERIMRQDVTRVLNALADKQSTLESTAADYATWTDTYDFMSDTNAAYIADNMVDGTLVNLGMNMAVFVEPSGNILYAKGVDLNSGTDAPVPADLLARVRSGQALLRALNAVEGVTGLMRTSKGSMLVAGRAILTSEGNGPRRGTLLMGRYLDAAEIDRITHITGMQLDVYPLDQPPARAEADALQALQQGAGVVVQPQDESNIAGYALLADITGEPAYMLRVHNVRAVYMEGQATLRYFLTVLGLAILVYSAFNLVSMEHGVLNRLTRLSASVVKIGNQGDFTARVKERQFDELGKLAGAINKMLAALSDAHQGLKRSEERYRSLIENNADGIVVIDRAQMIAYESPAVSQILGYSPKVDFAQSYMELIHPDDVQRLVLSLGDVAQQLGMTVSGEVRFRHKDGTWRTFEGTATNRVDDPSIEGVVINFRDITQRKQAEEQIQHQLANLTTLYAGAQKLAQSLDSLELAHDVARTCVETFDLRLAWVGRAEPEGQVSLQAQYPAESSFPGRVMARWDAASVSRDPIGRAICTRTPVIVNDLSDPEATPRYALMKEYGLYSGVAVPLISRRETFGALMLYSDQPGHFTPERVQFFQSYALLVAAALENARLLEQTERRLRFVQALHNIDTAIASSLDLNTTLDVILEQTTTQLGVDAASVLLYDSVKCVLLYTAGRGFHTPLVQKAHVELQERYAGRAVLERRTIVSDWWQRTDTEFRDPGYQALLNDEGFAAHVVTPLLAKGQVVGVLEVFHRAHLDANAEWLDLLETLAGQAAISIDGATIFEGLQRSNAELEKAYNSTLEGWSRAMDLRDKETEGHSRRVAAMTVDLGRAMGLSEAELIQVYRGALLHDIGKLGVPDSILLKPGKLTEEEWVIMHKHPQYAHDMIFPISYLEPAIAIPYCHHEKWDGTGYPRGLKGEEIPLAARIFAVVDVWDALTSDRPYRAAWPANRVREHIHKGAGTHFDPRVVEAFFRLRPSGSVLNSGYSLS
jgi:PAS domain S-box-containing protein